METMQRTQLAAQRTRDDVTLVARARAGDANALAGLVERMGCVPRMLRAKCARLESPLGESDLQDVVQDTLVAIWRKLDRFTGEAALETWVYRFCTLQLLEHLRRTRRLPHLLEDVATNEPAREALATELDLEAIYLGLERVPDDEARVVRMKHFDERTFDEIGAELSLSPNTVKTRYYRALERLRGHLEGRREREEERR